MASDEAKSNIHQLLVSLERLSPQLEGREEDLAFLRGMFQSNEFHSLMKVHREVSAATGSQETPVSYNALALAHSLSYDLETCPCPEGQELFDLLTSPHMDAIISVQDRVANKEYPVTPVISGSAEAAGGRVGDQPVTIVRIEKQNQPLGATVKETKDKSIVISRVLCGGAADKSNLLHPGDVIHEINGKSIQGYTVDDVADLMAGLTGTVVFKITPAVGEFRPKRRAQTPVYMRTYFSYDPAKDQNSPCPEAGLKFERGSILQVVNREDPEWWQAVRDGDRRHRAGIIPSKTRRERLESYISQKHHQQQRRKGKTKKMLYSSFDSETFGKEIATYEEMVKIEPQVDRPRPIMLVAPRGSPFNMDVLRARLIREQPTKFGYLRPHTSRQPRPDEDVDTSGYIFVTHGQMERAIQSNQFVEHGFLHGNYYGTSINSIRDVINSGKTCVLILAPQAMKLVRTSELRPFIVYFRTPSVDYIRNHWVPKGMITESSIADVSRQAGHLENTYSHYFDHSILFTDPESGHAELLRLIDRLMQDKQWVPASWTV